MKNGSLKIVCRSGPISRAAHKICRARSQEAASNCAEVGLRTIPCNSFLKYFYNSQRAFCRIKARTMGRAFAVVRACGKFCSAETGSRTFIVSLPARGSSLTIMRNP
jgi:hypothetical protein